mgnify:FL=1|nr:MAG TPA: hypothetical protein [Caudoviricetes sp.]
MDCFGVYSFFCIDSKKCRSCPKLKECMKVCYGELKGLERLGDVKKLLQKHIELMKAFEVKDEGDVESGQCSLSSEVLKLSNELKEQSLIGKGWIAKDLSEAPDFIRFATEYLYRVKETTSEKFVRYMTDRLKEPSVASTPESAVAMAAVTAQVLKKFEIIKVSGNKITWIGTSSE